MLKVGNRITKKEKEEVYNNLSAKNKKIYNEVNNRSKLKIVKTFLKYNKIKKPDFEIILDSQGQIGNLNVYFNEKYNERNPDLKGAQFFVYHTELMTSINYDLEQQRKKKK